MTKQQEAERQEAIEHLKTYLKQGDTVYTVLKHVSSSGMMRHIAVYVAGISERDEKPFVYQVSHLVAKVLGYKRADSGALKVGGAGMDMGYSVVYGLSSTLFRDDFPCIGPNCPSNDHSNDRDGSWSRENNEGRQHSDGGYALTHTWL